MKSSKFTSTPLFPRQALVALLLPLIAEQALSVTIGLADTLMVSSVGEAAVSGVSLVDSFNTLMIQIMSALATGGAVVTSQYIGHQEPKNAKAAAAQILFVLSSFSVLVAAVVIGGRHAILRGIFGSIDADVMHYAETYFLLSALSYPFIGLYNAGAALFRAQGNSKISMLSSLVMNVINIGGNAVLIFGLFGLPALGVQGAAIATVAARIIELAVIWFYCFRVQKAISIQPKELLKHESWAWRDYAKFGLPVGLTDAQWALVGLLKMAIIGYLGKTMMSAMNITDTMINLGTMFTFALAGGACVLVGKAVGAGDYARARQYSQTIQVLFACVGVVMCTIVFSLRSPFISLYGQEQDVVTLASQMIAIGAVTLLGTTYHASCFVGINRGAGDSRFVMTVDMICGWLVVLPLTYLAAFVWKLPLPLVFLCTRIDQCFKWIIAMVRLRGDRWIKNVTRP